MWAHPNKHMEVIGHAIDAKHFVIVGLADSRNVLVQALFPF